MTLVPVSKATNSNQTEAAVKVKSAHPHLWTVMVLIVKYLQQKKCNTILSLLSTISESLLSNTPRYQRMFAGSRKLPGRRALHQHRGLVPLPERGQLWDWLWAHWQQQLQRSVKLTSALLCNCMSESCLFTECSVPVFLWFIYPDIDECETGIHNCGPEFQCQNTQGSFRCLPKFKCGPGFIQDALGNCIGEHCTNDSSKMCASWRWFFNRSVGSSSFYWCFWGNLRPSIEDHHLAQSVTHTHGTMSKMSFYRVLL